MSKTIFWSLTLHQQKTRCREKALGTEFPSFGWGLNIERRENKSMGPTLNIFFDWVWKLESNERVGWMTRMPTKTI